jgi:mannose-1-phosphate guanylyltransferase
MFVWRTDVFLAELAARRPDVAEPIAEIAEAWDTEDQEETLARLWQAVPKVAVEYAVMEPAAEDGKVGTVPGDFGWSDIGDFQTVGDLLGVEVDGGRAFTPGGGKAVVVDGKGVVVVPAANRLISVLGLNDVIVVDTEDAVLVCSRERAQDIKRLTEILRERGELDLL